MKFKEMQKKLNSLTIFRSLLDEEVIVKFRILLDCNTLEVDNFVNCYCDFTSTLYKYDTNLSRYLYRYVMDDDNIYIKRMAQGKPVEKMIEQATMYELGVIQELSKFSSKEIVKDVPYSGFLPKWKNTNYHFKKAYLEKIDNLAVEGYGVYAKYHVFALRDQHLVPIKHPDPQRLQDLIGYEREREMVIKNTEAFLKGMKASNVLLYGDAGTGKSSTVKAIANAYYKQGLRLVELKKHQLFQLPEIIDELAKNPLKFIIFIDDLSFNGNDDNFVALKTILEGGVAGNTKNIVIYATTNRRHFVKESMKDRNHDELFTNDSIQETMSLAARFGLTVTFQKPGKDLFLEIVEQLAKENNLALQGEELIKEAEVFALRNNGRSPRTAKQFVELQKIKENVDE
ncbi:putative AAA+ superfamily ATPase [Breznakia sp. PF5-3]|uniref:ATP-binding protein n=1 Tax=unclassified Breznakia TaxID=2623764 RepID=UPI002404C9F2|nr:MULTISPECIES: ATP-binding protein [unclassified Breznakia]MDF9825853.1 putative AAA+ superfamily ATPase [Breznakia sp. PM6-1]MDF9836654.1 putative AAA+ superfamily ATPase [Breznakia sp. PF5-3]MDF9838149.1 putative AAA+ superfamily ATPase [Breznakia sp. PFB2-8]MDF9860135.1 putative AAA+ superfamily ATPase [Breznakia sp. PH5-24]